METTDVKLHNSIRFRWLTFRLAAFLGCPQHEKPTCRLTLTDCDHKAETNLLKLWMRLFNAKRILSIIRITNHHSTPRAHVSSAIFALILPFGLPPGLDGSPSYQWTYSFDQTARHLAKSYLFLHISITRAKELVQNAIDQSIDYLPPIKFYQKLWSGTHGRKSSYKITLICPFFDFSSFIPNRVQI